MAANRKRGRRQGEGEGRLGLPENINLIRAGFDRKGVLNADRGCDAADDFDCGVAAQCLARFGAERRQGRAETF